MTKLSFEWLTTLCQSPRDYALTFNMATISLNWPGDRKSENQPFTIFLQIVLSQFSNSQLGSVISHVRPPNKDIYRYLLNQYFLLSSRQPMSLTIELVLRISWYLAGVVEYRQGILFFCSTLRHAGHFIFHNFSFLTNFLEQDNRELLG